MIFSYLNLLRISYLVELTTMIPTTMKESCCDHMVTSMFTPSQFTRMSNVLVIGSTLPTLSNTMLTVEMKIFQVQ